MIFDILTLSPDIFTGFAGSGIVSRAIEKQILTLRTHNIRDYSKDKHNKVDDYPFGGGAGLVMTPQPLYDSLTEVMKLGDKAPVIYFTPQGRVLNQDIIDRYKEKERIILLCGQYKEIDHRIRDTLVTDEISIGDYVLSGGELPAMVFIDGVTRLLDGVLGDIDSALTDSHQQKLLGAPHYTRPASFMNLNVPEILLSGNHKQIDEWRERQAVNLTKRRRPDIIYDK